MTRERARVLVVAASKARAEALAAELSFLPRTIDASSERSLPRSFSPYRLLVGDLEERDPAKLLGRLRKDAQAILLVPGIDAAKTAALMRHAPVCHVINRDAPGLLPVTVEKLETGSIFGLDHYLPAAASVAYRRVQTFAERCAVIDELTEFAAEQKLRGRIRRTLVSVTEELLMNALYQGPVDQNGQRVFAEVSPEQRIEMASPQPVSVRYAVFGSAFCVSVRDRYGSFCRDDLARSLWRCVSEPQQIEQKKLGAGLGLYLVTSRVRALVINVLPGRLTEFICVVGEARKNQLLELVSVTTQVPVV